MPLENLVIKFCKLVKNEKIGVNFQKLTRETSKYKESQNINTEVHFQYIMNSRIAMRFSSVGHFISSFVQSLFLQKSYVVSGKK